MKYKLKRIWQWIQFGTIREVVRSVDGGFVSEVEYIGRWNRTVGYWAYGSFDPAGPYQG